MARRRPQVCKVDGNQPEIVKYLRARRYCVQPLNAVMGGCPDLLVACGPENVLVEVKMPGEKLNADQVKWHAHWPGTKIVAETGEEALKKLDDIFYDR